MQNAVCIRGNASVAGRAVDRASRRPEDLVERAAGLGVDVTVILRMVPVYFVWIITRMNYTGCCQNDFNVQGYAGRNVDDAAAVGPRHDQRPPEGR